MKKICFLDCDGVLNSDATFDYYGGWGGHFSETDPATEQNVRWGQELVDNLKYIVEQTGASIVISSTWRHYFSVEKFKEMFKVYGWDKAPVIAKTAELNYRSNTCRGLEINKYLSENKVDSYVILDDISQFLIEQQEAFVHTNMLDGLSFDDAKKAVEILNKTII